MKTLVLGAMPQEATPATHLPLGPWCFSGREELFPGWEDAFDFLPDALAEPERLNSAARAAQTLATRMLPKAAAMLSPKWHSLPQNYWETLLAPWAMNVATMLIDRIMLVSMLAPYRELELSVPVLPADCKFAFLDEQDFVLSGMRSLDFNHWLFSRILSQDWPKKWQKIELEPIERKLPPIKSPGLRERLLAHARNLNAGLLFPKLKGMSLSQAWRYSRALKKTTGAPDSLDLAEAFSFESDLAAVPLPENVEEIFRICLPKSLKDLKHAPLEQNQNGALRIGSIKAQEDAAYRQKLARWKAKGNRLGFCQHGGNYGMIHTAPTAQLVEYSQDCFITWGWKSNTRGRFIPLPSPYLCPIANAWTGGSGKLIFVGAEMPTLRHRLDSHPAPMQFVAYRKEKAEFFRHLPANIRDNSLYRPYFDLPGTLQDAQWLRGKFPDLAICEGPLMPQLLKCRLLVLDHHGTTLLEAMAADIPLICYWSREAWQLTSEADLMLDMLEDSGIWQPNAKAAAEKAASVWDNVQDWWQGAATRAARRIFCKNFALIQDNPDAIWLERLKKL